MIRWHDFVLIRNILHVDVVFDVAVVVIGASNTNIGGWDDVTDGARVV